MCDVSYILCVHNGEKYLKECCISLFNQQGARVEIIAVDDGSTDDSPQILKYFAKKDKRLRVLTQDNMGLSVARNRGIALSKGTYIASAAQDDVYLPTKTQEQIEFLKQKSLDFCFTSTLIIDGTGKPMVHKDEQLFNRNLWPHPFTLLDVLLNFPLCPPTFLCKRECYTSIHWNPAMMIFSDKNLFLKIFTRFAGGKVPKVLHRKRYTSNPHHFSIDRKRYPLRFLILEHRTSAASAFLSPLLSASLIIPFFPLLRLLKNYIRLDRDPENREAVADIAKLYAQLGFDYLASRLTDIASHL